MGFKLLDENTTEEDANNLNYLSLTELESFVDLLKPVVARKFKKYIGV